jgi:hypothetical protein
MSAALFGIQRVMGEELLAAGWHSSSIAVASKPGSAWVLSDPSRRIRVRMRADLADVMAEATATYPPARPLVSPQWRLTVHHAPIAAVIAALQAAPSAYGGGTVRDSFAISDALAATGMRPDRSRLARALSGTCMWLSPDRDAGATWTAPHRTTIGGWQILTPGLHLDATPGTPAAVLTPLITTPPTIWKETQQ